MKKYNKLEITGIILVLISLIFIFKLVEISDPYRDYGSIIAGIGGAFWYMGYHKKKTLKNKDN